VTTLRNQSGLDRGGFNPSVAAVVAWVMASGNDPRPDTLSRLLTSHFAGRIPNGFLEKYLAVRSPQDPKRIGPSAERDEMTAQAFIEAKSDTRHLIVATSPVGTFDDDSAFETDPIYSRAIAELDGVELALTALGDFDLSRCPKCQTVGVLESWFGTRRLGGRTIPQSWCRVCRSLRD